MIDIKGLDKAEVLKALYDHSHVQGLGFLQAVPDGTVTVEHCRELLEKETYFDYLYGKVLKVDLRHDEFAKQMINNADVVLRTDKLIAEGKLRESTIEKIVGSKPE